MSFFIISYIFSSTKIGEKEGSIVFAQKWRGKEKGGCPNSIYTCK
jgi:hypothetical protein